jgi:WD40 repeat protein
MVDAATFCQIDNSLINVTSQNDPIPRKALKFPHIVIPHQFTPPQEELPLATLSQPYQLSLTSLLDALKTIDTFRSKILPKPARETKPKSLKWHPFKQTFAFTVSDSCFIYDLSIEDYWPPNGLNHVDQYNVSCIAWHPTGASQIAVGGANGVSLY